jgi:hypothetical protein
MVNFLPPADEAVRDVSGAIRESMGTPRGSTRGGEGDRG